MSVGDDLQGGSVEGDGVHNEETALVLNVAVSGVVGDHDEVIQGLPVARGLLEGGSLVEGDGDALRGAVDSSDGGDLLEDHGGVLHGQGDGDELLVLGAILEGDVAGGHQVGRVGLVATLAEDGDEGRGGVGGVSRGGQGKGEEGEHLWRLLWGDEDLRRDEGWRT